MHLFRLSEGFSLVPERCVRAGTKGELQAVPPEEMPLVWCPWQTQSFKNVLLTEKPLFPSQIPSQSSPKHWLCTDSKVGLGGERPHLRGRTVALAKSTFQSMFLRELPSLPPHFQQ